MDTLIEWTPEMLVRFKRHFTLARDKDKVEFVFDGNEFVTNYAMYLIQHLENSFARRN